MREGEFQCRSRTEDCGLRRKRRRRGEGGARGKGREMRRGLGAGTPLGDRHSELGFRGASLGLLSC